MDPLPPDPYQALGVPKDCDQALIKSTYRKLVLKTHPDKFTDEAIKKQKQEEFHKIQQAYEILSDEDKRATYDAEVKLQQLRKERLSKAGSGGARVEVHATHYEIRTAAPAGPNVLPPRFEERKPTGSMSYDDDKYYEERSSSRKYDTYDSHKRSSPRASREKEPIRITRMSTDRTRSDPKKSRDKEQRRERSDKFVYVNDDSSSSDEKARFEAQYRRREQERRAEEEDVRRSRRSGKTEERRSAEDIRGHDRERKYNDLSSEALNYITRAREEVRPSPSRTTSSRDARPSDHYTRRSSEVRRSSARPKESRPVSSGRDRERKASAFPEIVEWGGEDDMERKAPPSFKHSVSSPPEVHTVRLPPQRSYTESSDRRREASPPPIFRRVETMPVHSSSSSRRKESSSTRIYESSRSTPNTPEMGYAASPTSTTKVYRYPDLGPVPVRLASDNVEVVNGHRTVRREPGSDRHRARSPSSIPPPPIGSNRVVQPSSSARYVQVPAAPQPPRTNATVPPPPLGRSATYVDSSERRGEDRGRKLYGEVSGSDYFKREAERHRTRVSPERVVYTTPIGPEDIRWSSGRGGMEKESDYSRPMLRKQQTSVY